MFLKKLLLTSLVILSFISCSRKVKHPVPTEIVEMKKKRKEFKRHRKEWIENMHKTAPGVNWEVIDSNNRLNLYKVKAELDEIAGGRLSGEWIERGSNNLAGRIHTADINPDGWTLYAGSSGGNIWKSSIGGDDWVSLNDDLQFSGIKMVRAIGHPPRVFVLCNNPSGLWYTDDDGVTWASASGLDGPAAWGGYKRGLITQDSTIYVLALEWEYDIWRSMTALYRSDDFGTSFSRLDTFHRDIKYFDLFNDQRTNEVYLIEENEIYRVSGDGLFPYSNFSYSGYDIARVYLGGAKRIDSDETVLYILHVFADGTKVYRATESSVTYRGQIDQSPFMENSLGVSQRNPDNVYIGCVDCFKSYDGGESFVKVNDWWEYYDEPETMLHADVPGIDIFYNSAVDDELIFISTDGGIYLSLDSMETVSNLSLNNLAVSQYYSTYTSWIDPNFVYAGSQDQGFQRTTAAGDGMIDFTQEISGDYGQIVSADSGRSIWSVYPGFAMYAPHIMASWSISTWDFETSGHLWMPPLCAVPGQPQKVYMGGGSITDGTRLITLTYSGGEISPSEGDQDFSVIDESNAISGIASPSPERIYIITNNGHFWRSTDGGDSWWRNADFDGPGGHYFYGTKILCSGEDSLWIGGSGYSNPPVYSSVDGGLTFTEDWEGLPNTLVYDLAANSDGSLIFAATEVGPFVRIEGIWYPMPGAPDQTYWSVEFVNPLNTARFGTYGRGIWDFRIDSVLSIEPARLPKRLKVIISPNPFNSKTHIRTELPADILIYDQMGRMIEKGSTENGVFVFDGEGLPSGTYLVLVKAGDQVVPRKMVLIR